MIMVLVLVVATALGLATALVLATVKDLLTALVLATVKDLATALVLATVKDLAIVLVQAPRVVMVLGLFTVVLDMVLVPKSAMVLFPSPAMDQLATVLRPLEAMVNHLEAMVV